MTAAAGGGAGAITSIADLPFVERPVIELLALDRDEPDPEYAGFGWARVPEVWLEAEDAAAVVVRDALVLAIHSADDAEPLDGDVDLAFEIDGRAFAVRLSAFLDRWMPSLPRDAGAIVLALCNDHGAVLARRPVLGDAALWYPVGATTAWLDVDTGRIRLVADAWKEATR